MYKDGLTLILTLERLPEMMRVYGPEFNKLQACVYETVFSQHGLSHYVEYQDVKNAKVSENIHDIVTDILEDATVCELLEVRLSPSYGGYPDTLIYSVLEDLITGLLSTDWVWNLTDHSVGEVKNISIIGPNTVAVIFDPAF